MLVILPWTIFWNKYGWQSQGPDRKWPRENPRGWKCQQLNPTAACSPSPRRGRPPNPAVEWAQAMAQEGLNAWDQNLWLRDLNVALSTTDSPPPKSFSIAKSFDIKCQNVEQIIKTGSLKHTCYPDTKHHYFTNYLYDNWDELKSIYMHTFFFCQGNCHFVFEWPNKTKCNEKIMMNKK